MVSFAERDPKNLALNRVPISSAVVCGTVLFCWKWLWTSSLNSERICKKFRC